MTSRSEGIRLFATAGAIALVGYVGLFFLIEKRRPSGGPWEATFVSEQPGKGAVIINQHRLGITNFRVELALTSAPSATLPQTLRFESAKAVPFNLPFGRCVFLDTTFLPGTVTMQIDGNELELLPRKLVANHRAYPWAAGGRLDLAQPANPPP